MTRGSRWHVAALLACWAGTAAAACGAGHRSAPHCERIAAAEATLARGDAAAALQLFEQAAAAEHAVDIELGIVRSQLQAGEFARALAFSAHTAGAHGHESAGTALYVWLLALSGQEAFARRVLDQARTRLPDDALLADMGRQVAGGLALPGSSTAQARATFSPYGVGDTPPAAARLASSGVLWDAGRRALVPIEAVRATGRIWVRDGLGRTSEAFVERPLDDAGVVVLRLARPPAGGDAEALSIAEVDAFPGSPAGALAYAGSATAAPAWPWLRQGFLGRVDADGHARRLGIDLPAGQLPGGPVLDLSGRLVGLVVGGGAADGSMLPASALRSAPGASMRPVTGAAAPPRLSPEQLYERALRITLQVIVVAP